MMLTAYLQMLSAQHRGLRTADRSLLYPMIHISDNEAASAVLAIVGAPALARVARDYLRHLPLSCQWRFDVVSVYYVERPSQPQFELFQNAFPVA